MRGTRIGVSFVAAFALLAVALPAAAAEAEPSSEPAYLAQIEKLRMERAQAIQADFETSWLLALTAEDLVLDHYPKDLMHGFVPVPDESGNGRRIVYSNGQQRVWMITESGRLWDTYLITGRRGIPATGHYKVFSKSVKAWAPYDGITMNYMVRFARGEWPYGFHDLPKWPDGSLLSTVDDLGHYGSGGCVRQEPEKAIRLFAWAPIGTPVIVTP